MCEIGEYYLGYITGYSPVFGHAMLLSNHSNLLNDWKR